MIKLLLIGLCLTFSISITSQPLEAEKLFVNPQVDRVQISPGGDYVSFHSRDDDDHYINFIFLKSNKVIGTIPLSIDNNLNSYQWIDESQLYISLNNSDRFIAKVTKDKIELRRIETNGYLVHALPEQPNKVLFARKKSSRSQYYDLYILDINLVIKDQIRSGDLIEHNSKRVSNYYYDDRYKRIITSEYDVKNKTVSIKYVSIEGGKWRNILKLKDTEYQLMPLDFISDDSIAVITNKDSDKMILREFNVNSKSFGKVIYQHPKYDLISAGFTDKGELNYVSYKQHGLKKSIYFNQGSSQLIERIANTFKNKEFYFIDQSKDANLNLMIINGSDEPGEYFIYNHNKDIISRLIVSYPELADTKFAPSKQLKVTTSDGTEIEAFLTLPLDINHSTLLVFPHGGPIGVQESDRFNKEVQYFASRGFSVLRINFRGSSGFGKAFSDRGIGEFGQLIEEDITAAVDHVTKQYQFEHMCAMGASYGGYSATMLAIKYPDKYECVIGAYGVYDLPLLFNASNYRSDEDYQKSVAKFVGEYNESLIKVSPVYLFKKLKAPILLIAGKDDDTADFEHSNRFNYLLKHNNQAVETVFYNNTGHGHDNWRGDSHDAAITHDFLVRSLSLKMPEAANLTDDQKKGYADDFMILADSYRTDEIDEANEFAYHLKAAEYDHPRGNFNIASHYHRGEQVKRDIGEAIKYYQKSADLGYAKAYGRLGRMYMDGEYLQQDWQKAHTYLTKAQELDDSPFNNIRLARFYCTAPENYKDVDQCLHLMELKQYTDRSKSIFRKAKGPIRETLAWIYATAKLTSEELKKVQQFTLSAFELTQVELTLENLQEGSFEFIESEKFGKSGEYNLNKKGFEVIATNDDKARFGLIFQTDVFGINRYRDQIAVAARWIKEDEIGGRQYILSTLLYGTPKVDWQLLRSFDKIKEDSAWTLEIYDLNQNLLYTGTYQVTPVTAQSTAKVIMTE